MCRFKSGIIFKGRVVLAPDGNESHSDLLEKLGVEDNEMGAMTRFVRLSYFRIIATKPLRLKNGYSM